MAQATADKKTDDAQGHQAHTKSADTMALSGEFQRPIKVTMLGAGSGFTPRLTHDIMEIPGNQGGEIAVVDIDENRLNVMIRMLNKIIADKGYQGWTVTGSTDRTEVLAGSDYVTSCIEVSGLACVEHDNDIPLKYGVDQCIGDTIGPGGLFKALRTGPVILEALADVQRLCPDAIFLNYTNPMSILCLSAGRAFPQQQFVGLCHSVQGTSHLIARYADVPYEEVTWECAGINHLAWFTKFEHKGENLYTKILYDKFRDEIAKGIAEAEAGQARFDSADTKEDLGYEMTDLIRKDMCVNFGAFITESSGHLSEYLPYYRNNEHGKKLLRLRYDGGSRFYATNWPDWRKAADQNREDVLSGKKDQREMKRSWEYASWIIEAREKDTPFRIHGNIMNFDPACSRGEAGKLITNLPGDGCVEVACMIDRNGINPTRYGALPPQMAAICASNMSMFDLAATAIIEKSKEAAIHSLMLDPLTAACCTPGQIRDMTNEMFEAEAEFLPGFK